MKPRPNNHRVFYVEEFSFTKGIRPLCISSAMHYVLSLGVKQPRKNKYLQSILKTKDFNFDDAVGIFCGLGGAMFSTQYYKFSKRESMSMTIWDFAEKNNEGVYMVDCIVMDCAGSKKKELKFNHVVIIHDGVVMDNGFMRSPNMMFLYPSRVIDFVTSYAWPSK